jgi:hypothetical protein
LSFLSISIIMGNTRSAQAAPPKNESPAPRLATIAEEGSVFSDMTSLTGARIIRPPKVNTLEYPGAPRKGTVLSHIYHNITLADDASSYSESTNQGGSTNNSTLSTKSLDPRFRSLPVVTSGDAKITFWTVNQAKQVELPSRIINSDKWVRFEPFKAFYPRHAWPDDEKSKSSSSIADKNDRYSPGNDEKSTSSEDSWTLFKMSTSFERTKAARDENGGIDLNASSTIFDGVDEEQSDAGEQSLMDLSAAFFSVVNEGNDDIETRPKKEPGTTQQDHSGRVFKYLERQGRGGNRSEAVRFLETAAILSELVLEQQLRRHTSKSQLLGSLFDDTMSARGGDMGSEFSEQSASVTQLFDDAMSQKRDLPADHKTTNQTVQEILEDLQNVSPKAISEFHVAIGRILRDIQSGDPIAMAERSANFFQKLDRSHAASTRAGSAWHETYENKHGKDESARVEGPCQTDSEKHSRQVEAHQVTFMKRGKPQTIKRSKGKALRLLFCCVRVDMILKRIASRESSSRS